MPTVESWPVFNNTASTTSNLIWTSGTASFGGNFTIPYVEVDPLSKPVEGSAKPQDPLDWLFGRVDEICELGYL